jgi:hypothetical protein
MDFTWASTRASERNPSPAQATRSSSQPHIEDFPATDFEELRLPINLPCYMLRAQSRNKHFTGRESMLQLLEERLCPDPQPQYSADGRPHAFTLCGLGGMGKTQTALEFAYSRKEKFDAVFWIQADEAVKIDETFSQIAVELRLLSALEAKDRIVSRNAVLAWLSEPYKDSMHPTELRELGETSELARWLLIFDNIDDSDMLRDYIPVIGNGSMLFTSRDPSSKHMVEPNAGVDLESLGLTESATFLQQLTYSAISDEDKRDCVSIAERVGGLPIAISHVAGIINSKDLTFAECLKAYEDESLVTETRNLIVAPTGNDRPLTTVWALDTLSPGALSLLQILSVLDPDVVAESLLTPKNIIRSLPDYPSSDAYIDTRSELTKASLIRRNKQEKSLTVHRMVQETARVLMEPDKLSSVVAFAVHLLELNWVEDREWTFGYRTSEWQIADSMTPHVLALKSIYERQNSTMEVESLRGYTSLVNRVST